MAVALSGCMSGNGGGESKESKSDSEPVTLSVFQQGANISDEEFQQYLAGPVTKKYANITLRLVHSGEGSTPEDLLASGTFPDLIYTSDKNINVFTRLGVAANLDDLVKKNKMDLQRFEPKMIETIKSHGDNGQLLAIPFSQNVGVMVYNKDIFEKFGVSYPVDGMDWDQVIALARKVNREADGIQYIGVDPGNIHTMGMGLSLPYIDAKTNKASINNDRWQRVYKTIQEMYQIPGYLGPKNKFKYGGGGFYKNKMVAMLPQWLNSVLGNVADPSVDGMRWDLVSQPN
ncbi:MAG: family 1 extracellular solute-binding protein, partial [Paenibacillaceae bacterium]|nr:family 1 extracellular solute-binding protein [Paenibacillaceae bacterium]